MTRDPSTIVRALATGLSSGIPGEFRYDVRADRWWWSDEVYRMHGFDPGDVVPTTALILAHKHPDDRARYAAGLGRASLEGGSFASVHRILDAHGQPRVLATVGEAQCDEADDAVVAITGFFVDVTAAVRELGASEATRRIRDRDARRAVIDQAVGVVSARTGVGPDEAFALLRAACANDGASLKSLAAEIVDAAATGASWPPATLVAPPGTVGDVLASPRPADGAVRTRRDGPR